MTGAYYNEIDPKAAAWLRELISKGHIAPGEVDERSIVDITPSEIQNFRQVHFFAGIGVWSYALRLAGWEDHRGVWTGSCPCQPFSQAGKGAGTADDRHLWPYWEHLIRELRPTVIFGEQVASKAADSWADLVQDDLEALDYAFGAVPFPAAGVGAPHIRDRLYWAAVADANGRHASTEREQRGGEHRLVAEDRPAGERMALTDAAERRTDATGGHQRHGEDAERPQGPGDVEGRSGDGRLADDAGAGRGQERADGRGQPSGDRTEGLSAGLESGGSSGELGHHHAGLEGRGLPAGERRGECTPWSASDFVWCRDGKWRPVEPGSFPLAHGAPARVGRLRGYGNAIVAEAAKVFIEASGLV